MNMRWIALLLLILPFTTIAQLPYSGPDFHLPLNRLKLTSGFGYRIHPFSRKWAFHAGLDLSACSDTVFCILNGIVTSTGYDARLGIYIRVDHGGNLQSTYGHLSVPWVFEKDTLSAGQPVGITGMSGKVTGEHLHFSVEWNHRPVNPLAFLKALIKQELPTNYKINPNEFNRNFFNPKASPAHRSARGRTDRRRSGVVWHRLAGHAV